MGYVILLWHSLSLPYNYLGWERVNCFFLISFIHIFSSPESKTHNGLTLTYFTARSNRVAYAFEWGETVTKSFNGEKLAAKD